MAEKKPLKQKSNDAKPVVRKKAAASSKTTNKSGKTVVASNKSKSAKPAAKPAAKSIKPAKAPLPTKAKPVKKAQVVKPAGKTKPTATVLKSKAAKPQKKLAAPAKLKAGAAKKTTAPKKSAVVKKGIKPIVKKAIPKKPVAVKATRKVKAAVPAKPQPKAAKVRTAAESVSKKKKKTVAPTPAEETASKALKRKYTRRVAPAPAPVLTPKYQGKQVGHGRKSVVVGEGRGVQKKSVQYSREDLEYFRSIIVEKIQEANEELVSIEERLLDQAAGEFNDDDSTYSLHMADQGTDAMEREKAFLFAQRERKFISHLSDALQRITSGNYGICINCGDLIEKGRLEAVPHARMCVSCKNRSKQPE